MKKIYYLALSLFLLSLPITAQDTIQVNRNTIEDQMIDVFDKSNSYQEYKVIKKSKIYTLRQSILDSVSMLEGKISTQQQALSQQNKKIDSLQQNLNTTQQNLAISKEKEDSIKLFGILTSKSVYNTIMWSIIIILLLIGGFLFYRFLNSHKITNAAQLKMAEMEIELEDYRRNSLEREQKLRRKLQDEINKNRKA